MYEDVRRRARVETVEVMGPAIGDIEVLSQGN
jgi:hypothetical protein